MSTGTGTNSIKVEDIRDLVIFLKEQHVKRFRNRDLEIEIDTAIAAIKDATPDELDKEVRKTKALFESTAEDEEKALFWSSAK